MEFKELNGIKFAYVGFFRNDFNSDKPFGVIEIQKDQECHICKTVKYKVLAVDNSDGKYEYGRICYDCIVEAFDIYNGT